jgi:D-inositol-3-phosphate glycosyltransferase
VQYEHSTEIENGGFMRIAMLSYHTCPIATLGGKDTGGMNVYVRELTRSLGTAKIRVDVFTRSQDEHVPHVIHDLGNGNRVIHIPAGPETPLPRDRWAEFIGAFSDGILRFQEGGKDPYDLIHSHYWLSGLAGLRLRREWGVPMVQMFHTLGVMKSRLGGTIEDRDRIAAERSLLASADRVIAATPAERMQLQWLYQADLRKVVVIPPGVDLAVFRPMVQAKARERIGMIGEGQMILYVGRIERLKGIETLLRASAILQDRGVLTPPCPCVAVIGGDPENPREEMSFLQELRTALNIQNVVQFLGRRPQNELPWYYSAAQVVVMPSQYESFGMVALEAMACGTPVVASGVGGLLYLVRDGKTGFHIPDSDPGALADKLQLLLSDEHLRNELGRHAASVARSYSWDRITDQVLTLYESMLAGRREKAMPVDHMH